jgi:hypothetical protein
MNQKYIIEHGLLSAITEYLATKPYREVIHLMMAIQKIEPLKQESMDADLHE